MVVRQGYQTLYEHQPVANGASLPMPLFLLINPQYVDHTLRRKYLRLADPLVHASRSPTCQLRSKTQDMPFLSLFLFPVPLSPVRLVEPRGNWNTVLRESGSPVIMLISWTAWGKVGGGYARKTWFTVKWDFMATRCTKLDSSMVR